MIFSLQGGMASGKTTAARYIEAHVPGVTVSYENPKPLLERIKTAGLNHFVQEDYCKIQRMFIEAELERYHALHRCDNVVFDLGPEEIEFYTLHFPRSIGADWDVERALADELRALRECRLDGILFLDTDAEAMRRHKEADATRGRNFFEHYIARMHGMKRDWFAQRMNVTFLATHGKTPDEMGEEVVRWLNAHFSPVQSQFA